MSSHSREFIEEMKALLESEKKQLHVELGQIAHSENGEYQADYPDYGRDDESNAIEAAEFQNKSVVTQANEARLKEVEAALERIEQGVYGTTTDGDQIPEERLRANPAATTLVKPT